MLGNVRLESSRHMGFLQIFVGEVEFPANVVDLPGDVDGDAEDAASVDEALSEEPEHGVGDFSRWRDDESGYDECGSNDKHSDG